MWRLTPNDRSSRLLRKAGELLQQLERAPEGRPQKLDQPGIVSEYRAAKLGLEAANHAAEVKLRAERKAGELLQQLERAPGARTDIQPSNSVLQGSEYSAVLEESDINRMTAHRWQTVAQVPGSYNHRYQIENVKHSYALKRRAIVGQSYRLRRLS